MKTEDEIIRAAFAVHCGIKYELPCESLDRAVAMGQFVALCWVAGLLGKDRTSPNPLAAGLPEMLAKYRAEIDEMIAVFVTPTAVGVTN